MDLELLGRLPELVEGFEPSPSQRVVLGSFALMRLEDQKKTINALLDSNTDLKQLLATKINEIKGVKIPIEESRRERMKRFSSYGIIAEGDDIAETTNVVLEHYPGANGKLVGSRGLKSLDKNREYFFDGFKINPESKILASTPTLFKSKEYHKIVEFKDEQRYQDSYKKLIQKYGQEDADAIVERIKSQKQHYRIPTIEFFKKYVNFSVEYKKTKTTSVLVCYCYEKHKSCLETTEKGMKSMYGLFRHLSTVHFFSIAPLKCPHCGMRFRAHDDLNHHIKLHMPVKTFECLECGYGTPTRKVMIYHVNTHKGIFRFSCPKCPRKYNITTDYKRHLASHKLLKRPMYCKKCENRPKFVSSADYYHHSMQFHGGRKKISESKSRNQLRQKEMYLRKLHVDGGISKEEMESEISKCWDEYRAEQRSKGIDPSRKRKLEKYPKNRKSRASDYDSRTSASESFAGSASSSGSDSSAESSSDSETENEMSDSQSRPKRSAAKKANKVVKRISKSELTSDKDNESDGIFDSLSLHSVDGRSESPLDFKPSLKDLQLSLEMLKAKKKSSSKSKTKSSRNEKKKASSKPSWAQDTTEAESAAASSNSGTDSSDSESLSGSDSSSSSSSSSISSSASSSSDSEVSADKDWHDFMPSVANTGIASDKLLDESVKVIKLNSKTQKVRRKDKSKPTTKKNNKSNERKSVQRKDANMDESITSTTTNDVPAICENHKNKTKPRKRNAVLDKDTLMDAISKLGPELNINNLSKKYLSTKPKTGLKKATKRKRKRITVTEVEVDWEQASDDDETERKVLAIEGPEDTPPVQSLPTEFYAVPDLQDLRSPAPHSTL